MRLPGTFHRHAESSVSQPAQTPGSQSLSELTHRASQLAIDEGQPARLSATIARERRLSQLISAIYASLLSRESCI